MGTLLVAYDLGPDEKSFEGVSKEIKEIASGNGWWHHLQAAWLLRTDLTPETVRDRLKIHLKPDDRILVVDVSGSARAWFGLTDHSGRWLRERW